MPSNLSKPAKSGSRVRISRGKKWVEKHEDGHLRESAKCAWCGEGFMAKSAELAKGTGTMCSKKCAGRDRARTFAIRRNSITGIANQHDKNNRIVALDEEGNQIVSQDAKGPATRWYKPIPEDKPRTEFDEPDHDNACPEEVHRAWGGCGRFDDGVPDRPATEYHYYSDRFLQLIEDNKDKIDSNAGKSWNVVEQRWELTYPKDISQTRCYKCGADKINNNVVEAKQDKLSHMCPDCLAAVVLEQEKRNAENQENRRPKTCKERATDKKRRLAREYYSGEQVRRLPI